MSNSDRFTLERARLLDTERPVPTSSFARLWRTGRSALPLMAATLGTRLRGRSGGLSGADVEDITLLVERLGELKGVAMKLGQILSYIDPTLPPELSRLLGLLQTAAPASPFSTVEKTLREAFGARAEELLVGLERAPCAVASIGQVHRGKIGGVDVAVKVRHPGIEEALQKDFSAASIGPLMARLLAPSAGASVKDAVEEAKTAMLEECNFSLEARRQSQFEAWFRGHPTLRVPAVLEPWCSEKVLTTMWSPGLSLDEWLSRGPSQDERDRAGAALFELYFSPLYRHGAFHADPHPGNYAFGEDGSVIVYDFGCVRSFDPLAVKAFARLCCAVRSGDDGAIAEAFGELGAKVPSDEKARAVLHEMLRGFFAPLIRPGVHPIEPGPGFNTKTLMSDKKALMNLSIPGKLLFLLRIRFGLYAVLARTRAVADWATLEGEWAAEVLKPNTHRKIANERPLFAA